MCKLWTPSARPAESMCMSCPLGGCLHCSEGREHRWGWDTAGPVLASERFYPQTKVTAMEKAPHPCIPPSPQEPSPCSGPIPEQQGNWGWTLNSECEVTAPRHQCGLTSASFALFFPKQNPKKQLEKATGGSVVRGCRSGYSTCLACVRPWV